MKDVKRIEIVVEAAQQATVQRLIEEAGISGFTLMPTLVGRGQRGDRDGDGLSNAFQNVCFVVAASEQETTSFVEALRPVLRRSGGVCLVSDAKWLKH